MLSRVIAKHWTTFITWAAILAGFIFNTGAQYRDIQQLKQSLVTIGAGQAINTTRIEDMQKDIVRLQLMRDVQGTSLGEIKQEIAEVRITTQKTDKAIAVIAQAMNIRIHNE